MIAKSFSMSKQGASHIKKGKECQDSSCCYPDIPIASDDKIAIAIICDGHGGNDYMRSAIGSQRACEVSLKNIKSFIENASYEQILEDIDKRQMLKNLEASIICDWNGLIRSHYEANPFTEEELSGISERARRKYTQEDRIESAYGTTVVAVAMTPQYGFGIQIGDGKCVVVDREGRFSQPIPWNDKCFLNATTSICDSDAYDNFREIYFESLPAAAFVGSDGIDDCFKDLAHRREYCAAPCRPNNRSGQNGAGRPPSHR